MFILTGTFHQQVMGSDFCSCAAEGLRKRKGNKSQKTRTDVLLILIKCISDCFSLLLSFQIWNRTANGRPLT